MPPRTPYHAWAREPSNLLGLPPSPSSLQIPKLLFPSSYTRAPQPLSLPLSAAPASGADPCKGVLLGAVPPHPLPGASSTQPQRWLCPAAGSGGSLRCLFLSSGGSFARRIALFSSSVSWPKLLLLFRIMAPAAALNRPDHPANVKSTGCSELFIPEVMNLLHPFLPVHYICCCDFFSHNS